MNKYWLVGVAMVAGLATVTAQAHCHGRSHGCRSLGCRARLCGYEGSHCATPCGSSCAHVACAGTATEERTVLQTVYEQEQYTENRTICETVWKDVERTCYRTVTETAYRDVTRTVN